VTVFEMERVPAKNEGPGSTSDASFPRGIDLPAIDDDAPLFLISADGLTPPDPGAPNGV
jgi:hypothetical protein